MNEVGELPTADMADLKTIVGIEIVGLRKVGTAGSGGFVGTEAGYLIQCYWSVADHNCSVNTGFRNWYTDLVDCPVEADSLLVVKHVVKHVVCLEYSSNKCLSTRDSQFVAVLHLAAP